MSQTPTETLELAVRLPLPSSSSTIYAIPPDDEAQTQDETHTSSSSVILQNSSNTNESMLAPVDRGFGAWSFLTAAFFVEAIVWGFPNSFGIFLDAYLNEQSMYATQKNASTLLPLIGPLSSGIMYCSGIFVFPILARYPNHRRHILAFGALLCYGSLFAASYATQVMELVVLQGAMYAIGGSLLYSPCISYMSEWFVNRRGMANGVLFSGTAIGGLVLPLILSQFIEKFGPSKTIRILSIAVGVLLIPFIPFVKGRLPLARTSNPRARLSDPSWIRSKTFWSILAVNTVQGFAYFIPMLWLPTFSNALNLGATDSSVVLAVLNAASCVGRTGMGFLSDRYNPWNLAIFTLTGTSLAVFVLWGVLSHTFGALIAFSIVYGTIAAGWTSLWTAFVRPIAKDEPLLTTKLFSYLLFSRGIGNILSTPISTSLIKTSKAWTDGKHLGFDVGNGIYQNMIVYVGTCFAGASVLAFLGWSMEVGRRR